MKKKKYIKCNAISNENIFFLSSFKKFFAHYNLELSTKKFLYHKRFISKLHINTIIIITKCNIIVIAYML